MPPSKWLLIGDPHAVLDEIEDCRALIQGIVDTIRREGPDYVVFLGDQCHNFALLHIEVVAFWRETFKDLRRQFPEVKFIAMVGNHDLPGDGASSNHSMLVCEDLVTVIDYPQMIGGVLLLPYFADGQRFRDAVIGHPTAKTVICHQTLVGSHYENGFIAHDGISLERLEDKHFISGHIHTPQRYDNVTYIGAPRWRGLMDANVERALVLFEIEPNGPPRATKLFKTDQWCRKLLHVVDTQEKPLEASLNPRWKYIVDLHGDAAYIEARRGLYAGQRLRTFRTQVEEVKPVRESMGISAAIQVFINTYQSKFGTETAILKKMAAERLQP